MKLSSFNISFLTSVVSHTCSVINNILIENLFIGMFLVDMIECSKPRQTNYRLAEICLNCR